MSIWSIALTLFLVANPIGNTPIFVSLVKDFDFQKQKKILLREAFFSFCIAIAFLCIGEPFLETLHIETYSMSLCGGILLFLVSLEMIFPLPSHEEHHTPKEPFIVPIATPLITGGGVLSTIIIYSQNEQNFLKIFGACCIAWIFVTIIVVSAVYIQKILGRKGLLAMEQLMGMLLAMMSTELIVRGLTLFLQTLNN
jgi:multiple antibiotic resistance protein